ncbi:MAG: hypothetical protein H6811_10810 [Phycisphaeraceae bacterium]|nr:hypothetical protein [Phycisphaeraceae bacterium]
MLPNSSLSIHLSPSRLETVLSAGGRVKRADRVDLDPARWASCWNDELRPLDALLRKSLERVGARRGMSARVFYISPDCVVGLKTVPAVGAAARAAARLALTDMVEFDASSCPTSLHVLGVDRTGAAGTHVVLAADKDSTTDAVAAWVERAGCRVGTIGPSLAGILDAVAAERLTSPETGIDLFIGEHFSVLVAAGEGRLEFARTISCGYSALLDAIARSERTEDEAHATPRAEIATKLFECGLVRSKNNGPGLSADAFALMQPILQRLVIEVKQTLRFMLRGKSTTPQRMKLKGPGGTIPGLADLLSASLELDVEPADGVGTHTPLAACAPGGEACALALGLGRAFDLAPRRIESRRLLTRARAAVAIGVLGVAGLAVSDAMMTIRRTDRARLELASSDGAMASVERIQGVVDEAMRLAEDVGSAERSLEEAISGRPTWSGLLAELARLADENVRLTDIRGQTGPLGSIVLISGVAFQSDDRRTDTLRDFVDGLKSSAAVGGVSLGTAKSTEIHGRRAKRFELEVTLATLPSLAQVPQEGP